MLDSERESGDETIVCEVCTIFKEIVLVCQESGVCDTTRNRTTSALHSQDQSNTVV